jgi:hypothetical protein
VFKKMRVFGLLLAWPLVLSVAGCDCDEGRGPDAGIPTDGPRPFDCEGTEGRSVSCDANTAACCVRDTGEPICVTIPFCGSPFLCDALEQPDAENGCTFGAPLDPGQLATHLDVAAAADETVMLSGYSPGRATRTRYGDLVVGLVSDGEVQWSIVDGVPAGPPVVSNDISPDPDGWRGGITAAGDNVGEFNSIAFSPAGVLAVSYYDRTNGDLKFAYSRDGGTTWSIQTVFTDGDSGRYTSLAFMVDGRPAISYLSMIPSEDPAQPPRSLIRVSVSGIPLTADQAPGASTDWVTFPIVAEPGTPMACRADLCGGGLLCRVTGACATESADADVDCSYVDEDGVSQVGCDGTSCVMGAMGFECAEIIDEDFIEDVPEANGLYTSLRATNTGLALVWHDRARRTLMGSAFDAAANAGAGQWRPPFRIDGFDAVGSGDAGYNADLFIDAAGDWHVAYVDGAFEELRHAVITASTLGNANPTLVRSRVDDGTRPPRERSIVGSDADIVVLNSGEVRIVYQDSTQAEALVAIRAAGQGSWVLQGGNAGDPLDTEDSTGFWTCQTLIGDTSHMATWWFNITDGVNGTRVFTLP